MTDATLGISGMKCDGCVECVQEALEAVDGVERVTVSPERGLARVVTAGRTPESELATAVEDAGYQVENPE